MSNEKNQNKKEEEDKKVDEALEESFPSSDPPAFNQPGPSEKK